MSTEPSQTASWAPVWVGSLLAVGVTTAMDASGYSMLSALPLALWLVLVWWWQKYSRIEVGYCWGERKYYGAALAYPLFVMGALVLLATISGEVDTSKADWNKVLLNLFIGGFSTILVTAITEEGFFRGALWAACRRAGAGQAKTLLITTLIFVAWHLSAVSLDTGFDLPAWQIPIYLVNAILMGLVWGMLRLISGSILVASVCHGIWNGMAYSLFGFGQKTGALGIVDTWIWGPEVGLVGIVLNLAVVIRFRSLLLRVER